MAYLKMSSFKRKTILTGNEDFVALDSTGNIKFSIDAIKAFFGITQSLQLGGIVAPADSPQPTGDYFWIAPSPGTYTHFNGVVVPANSFAFISRVGGVWKYGIVTVPVAQNKIYGWLAQTYLAGEQVNYGGQIYEAVVNTTAGQVPGVVAASIWKPVLDMVKSTQLFNGQNKYLYTEDIDGFYIGATLGDLQASATSSISKIYPITAGETIYIINRVGNTGFRFVNAGGAALIPLKEDGTPFPNFASLLNGGVKAPVGAVGWQMTTRFVGSTNRTNTIVSSDPAGVLKIKPELIPADPITAALLTGLRTDVNANTAAIAVINGGAIMPRINKYENTDTPEALPVKTEVLNFFGVTVSNDTTSPTKDIIGKKRTFLNTMTPDGASCYTNWPIPLGASRPPVISVAFWVKKSQFQALYTTRYETYLGLRVFGFTITQINQLLAGTPIVSTGNVTTINEYTTATCTVTKIAEIGDYIRIRQTYSDILWKGSFVGTSILFYFLFNGNAGFQNKPLDLMDFTLLFNAEPTGTVIYPDPDGNFGSNVKTFAGLEAQIALVNDSIEELREEVKANIGGVSTVHLRSGNIFYFSSPFNSTRNLVKRVDYSRASSFNGNPDSNFNAEFLATKGADQTASVLSIKASSDDICPANLNGSYIGGNHGWGGKVYLLTKAAHTKNFTDLANVYTDTVGVQFVILRRVDADNLWVVSMNQAVDGFTYNFVAPTGTLTYLSGGGANQGTITGYTVAAIANFWPSIGDVQTKIYLNGTKEVNTIGDYECDFADIAEDYYAFDLPSIIAKIIANRPVGGYLDNVLFNSLGADPLFSHTIIYRFKSNGSTLVFHGFSNNKKLVNNFHGFVQAGALATGDIYVPKSLPINGGNRTYNLTNREAWTTGPTLALHLTPAYWEYPLSPPDRVININADVVFHIGYILDRGVGINRKDRVLDAIFLNTSKKIYPMALSIPGNLEANSFYSCVAFRQYLNPANNPAGRTNYSWEDVDGIVWIWLDYHGSLRDAITPLSDWRGKKIEVYEKNANVTILADVVTDKIEIISTATSSSYGFAVLKLI